MASELPGKARRAKVPLAIVAAIGQNGVIGKGRGLPWHLPSDLKHFRAVTMGKPLLMGRKTFESIGRPLPGRETIIVTSDPAYNPAGPGKACPFIFPLILKPPPRLAKSARPPS